MLTTQQLLAEELSAEEFDQLFPKVTKRDLQEWLDFPASRHPNRGGMAWENDNQKGVWRTFKRYDHFLALGKTWKDVLRAVVTGKTEGSE